MTKPIKRAQSGQVVVQGVADWQMPEAFKDELQEIINDSREPLFDGNKNGFINLDKLIMKLRANYSRNLQKVHAHAYQVGYQTAKDDLTKDAPIS